MSKRNRDKRKKQKIKNEKKCMKFSAQRRKDRKKEKK